MEYQFRNIVGQSGSITLLQRSVMRKNLGKITILEGLHGTGKTTAALTIAKRARMASHVYIARIAGQS